MPLVSSPKTKILLLSEETPIASFILDVLSSVDYEVLFSEDLVFHHHFSPMILMEFLLADTVPSDPNP